MLQGNLLGMLNFLPVTDYVMLQRALFSLKYCQSVTKDGLEFVYDLENFGLGGFGHDGSVSYEA